MKIYVDYDNDSFLYESSIVPKVGESIIYERDNDIVTRYLTVTSVSHYISGEYAEVHIIANLDYEEEYE